MEEKQMSNLVVNNTEMMKQFFENLPEAMKEKYLWIPIAGMTIASVIASTAKSIRDNDCEAQLKIGAFEANLRPAKTQVVQ